MAGPRAGYLSQVVRDARPRAAPSLYAGAPTPNPTAREAPEYARLMESRPKSDLIAPDPVGRQGAAEDTLDPIPPARVTREVPGTDDDEIGQRPSRIATQRMDRAGPPDPRVPSQTADAAPQPAAIPAEGGEDYRFPPDPVIETAENGSPIEPRVRVSAARPRSSSFDVVDGSEVPSPSNFSDVDQQAAEHEPTQYVPARQDVSKEDTPSLGTPRHIRNVAPAPTPPPGRPDPGRSVQPRERNAGIAAEAARPEVHIGQVEIIVQDPPAPRAPVAPRAAPQPPSPARYHIRRF